MKRAALTMAFALGTLSAQAQTVFVSDKLVVTVYAEANQDSEKVETLESGASVEAGEKNEGFTHVKLADGSEGWIRSNYLSTQTPAIVRLKELEKERGASSSIPAKVTEELKQLRDTNAALRAENESLRKNAPVAQNKPEEPREPVPIVRAEMPESLAHWPWGVGIAVAFGLAGFALGHRMIAARLRKKYGSLKIY